MRGLCLTIMLSVMCVVAVGQTPADLVLRNGKIVTVDQKIGEVQALAARDGRIVAVGSEDEIKRYIGPSTQIIDLKGHLAIPGFIEGHGHFTSIGSAMQTLNLMGVKNWKEVILLPKKKRLGKSSQWVME